MFHLIKFIIWLVGLVVVLSFALTYFGYKFNLNYFSASKEFCQQEMRDCSKNIFENGIKNFKCNFTCIDPKLIIKKQ